MYARAWSVQGVVRVADEFVVDIWLPSKVNAKIERRKIGTSQLEVHGVALV